ncbi:BREX system P-loop protein BrxC [Verrucomicrobiales bacterium]|nr:BREX system P-loop protein BrxC [Verrucomicrobiales bacterium]
MSDTIRDLFDSSRALSRSIEKVITYQNHSDEQLQKEISEYIVTDHIDESFEELLKKMQLAQQGGKGHEIGVWVSGFYGSGKSSFTKYLGFALDRDKKLGDNTFLHLLQNQLRSAGSKAIFNQVSKVYDAEVVFLDLASEMLAGASMADVSEVLYLKVLQWAGYSEDLKVAELERKLESDGRLDEFKARAKEELEGVEWVDAHNQPLAANSIAARLAGEFYPELFKTAADFQNLTLSVKKSEVNRVKEMVDLVRRKSGKKTILFIIDEIGQYVSAKSNLILNLQGLAENLKEVGEGNVWLFATAQQTLTEDNPNAALNSPELYKLKDRFPIGVHLEASDIKEICHRRLLTKSSAGEKKLATQFETHGPSLRTSTGLTDSGVYEVELTQKVFTDLYPFLPAHFEILLQLLGRLAKKTGGLGLRSAIKVVQDVLIERGRDEKPLGDEAVGEIANTVTFYDSLKRDIMSTFPYVVEGVDRVCERLPKESLCIAVAKSVAVLQILENLPVTAENIAALLQSSVSKPSLRDDVEKAIATILDDGMIPFGEKDGSLRFLTLAAVTLQQKFETTEYRQADVRAEINGAIRSLFTPLPSARLENVRPVKAGLKVDIGGGQYVSQAGDKEAIQIHVEFAPNTAYTNVRTERENDSRSSKEKANIHLLGRSVPEADKLAVTIVKCRKFLDSHTSSADPDTQDFKRAIESRRERAISDLQRKLTDSLFNGSFVFQGGHEAVSGHGTELIEAGKSFLGSAAKKIFDRYQEASHQADSKLAEKFLKTPIDRITSDEDPLGLVVRPGGSPQVDTKNKALLSICDYLSKMGQVEGRRILDHFSAPPFGWSKDTTRYLIAAGFLGGELKLRIAGTDHKVKNDEALAAFASNRAIGAVGISQRDGKPDPLKMLQAKDRLTEFTGRSISLTEDDIAAAARKEFPTFQAAFSPLAGELRGFGLPDECCERAENLTDSLTELVKGDGSDTIDRLGSDDNTLYEDLKWARALKKTLSDGLSVKLSHLRRVQIEIEDLPDVGLPAQLKNEASEPLEQVKEILNRVAFHEETAALATCSDALDQLVSSTVESLADQQEKQKLQTLGAWEESSDWSKLDAEEHNWLKNEVAALKCVVQGDLGGLKALLNHDYALNHRLRDLEDHLKEKAKETPPPKPPEDDDGGEGEVQNETLLLPATLSSANDVENLGQQLQDYLAKFQAGEKLKITLQLMSNKGDS